MAALRELNLLLADIGVRRVLLATPHPVTRRKTALDYFLAARHNRGTAGLARLLAELRRTIR